MNIVYEKTFHLGLDIFYFFIRLLHIKLLDVKLLEAPDVGFTGKK